MTKNKIESDYLLSRINEMFKIVDISNPIIIAQSEKDAIQINKTQNYDRVPIKGENDNIEEYYDSNAQNRNKIIKIKPNDLISESYGILETFNYFLNKDFYFVLTGNKITNMIHYSDLNKPLVLSAIYTQIAYCEIAIREYLKCKNKYGNNEEELKNFLESMKIKVPCIEKHIRDAIKRFDCNKKNNIETNVLDELHFYDELILFRELISMLSDDQIIKFKENVNLDGNKITLYKNLRNYIMHSKKQIIKKKIYDITKWVDFLKTCQNIISYVETCLNSRN